MRRTLRLKPIWEGVIAASATLTALAIPLHLVLGSHVLHKLEFVDWLITAFYTADVVIHLRWAAARPTASETSGGNPPRYGWVWLIVDIAAAVPVYALFPTPVFFLFRLAKLARVAQTMRNTRRRLVQHWSALRLAFFGYWFSISVHWLATGWLALRGVGDHENYASAYLQALYWCVQTLSTVGYGDVTPSTDAEHLYAMMVMIVGVAVYGYVIGNVASILANIDPARAHYLETMERLTAFIKYRNIPPQLQRRIRDYHTYLWEKRLGYDETTVLAGLPAGLASEVSLYLRKDIISKVPFFQGAGEDLVRGVALLMRHVVLTPGDFVFKAGDVGREMYFISRGTLEVISRDGTSVYTTLRDGDFFGEIALLLGKPRSASVRAKEYCDLYILDKDSFTRFIADHQGFAAHIKAMVKERQDRGM